MKISSQRQQGVILLVCLVLILLVTVLSLSSLRSTIFNVKTTALIQQETQAYHLLNAELVGQLDALSQQKQTNPIAFETFLTDILDSATGLNIGGTQSVANFATSITVTGANLLDNPTVTIAGWQAGTGTNPNLGVDGLQIPKIERSLCPLNSSINTTCFNFVVVVQGDIAGTGITLQQISGFWMPNANSNLN